MLSKSCPVAGWLDSRNILLEFTRKCIGSPAV